MVTFMERCGIFDLFEMDYLWAMGFKEFIIIFC